MKFIDYKFHFYYLQFPIFHSKKKIIFFQYKFSEIYRLKISFLLRSIMINKSEKSK